MQKRDVVKLLAGVACLLVVGAVPGEALQAGGAPVAQDAVKTATRQAQTNGKRAVLPAPAPGAGGDKVNPPVNADVSCPLPQVLQSAGERMKELVRNLQQFTAVELVEHGQLGKPSWRTPETVKFEYVAELHEAGAGVLYIYETRSGAPNSFPGGVADNGLPAMALIFHPYFVDEYTMSCDGLSQWEGRPAWQVSFQQRPDRPARIRSYLVSGRLFPVKVKGRAWIATDQFQLLHLETDLLDPIPEIRLIKEHVEVDYDPVRFKRSDMELWLPSTADVLMDFQGRTYHNRHSFSNFLLFSVDVDQKIAEPKAQ